VSEWFDESAVMRNADAMNSLNGEETERNQKRRAASVKGLNHPMARQSSLAGILPETGLRKPESGGIAAYAR